MPLIPARKRLSICIPNSGTRVQVLIVDEADLLLSYGYEADLQALTPLVPVSAQRMLMSATASEEVSRLASLILQDPISIDLTASSAPDAPVRAPAITHTYVKVDSEAHRLLAVLALLRLGLVAKKVLLFVNSPDMAYRVRLLVEAFGVRAGTLVATLPLASRQRAIEQFNAAAFDVLVASESLAKEADDAHTENSCGKSVEYGVTRGVDFKGVRTVVNVENSAALSEYTHRVGRTGRAGAEGLAISLVGPKDGAFFEMLQKSMPVRFSESSGLSPPCSYHSALFLLQALMTWKLRLQQLRVNQHSLLLQSYLMFSSMYYCVPNTPTVLCAHPRAQPISACCVSTRVRAWMSAWP